MPRLNGARTTWAPAARASSAVASVEPSSTTRMSKSGLRRRISSTTPRTHPSSLYAGTIASGLWKREGMRMALGAFPSSSSRTEEARRSCVILASSDAGTGGVAGRGVGLGVVTQTMVAQVAAHAGGVGERGPVARGHVAEAPTQAVVHVQRGQMGEPQPPLAEREEEQRVLQAQTERVGHRHPPLATAGPDQVAHAVEVLPLARELAPRQERAQRPEQRD